jgi:hypothetical protein
MLQARYRTETARDELARCGPADLAGAVLLRDELLRAARSLVAAVAHDPDSADCTDAGCALAEHVDPPRCVLAHRLAAVEPGPWPTLTFEVALSRFDAAIGDSIEAVRRCRQTEHGAGRCWFSPVPGVDGCGEILRTAHHLC